MIGVAADDADAEVVEEFFELFKTAWEPAVRGRAYEVVLATTECAVDLDAAVLLLYGSRERAAERQAAIAIDTVSGPHQVNWAEWAFPLYGPAGVFTGGI